MDHPDLDERSKRVRTTGDSRSVKFRPRGESCPDYIPEGPTRERVTGGAADPSLENPEEAAIVVDLVERLLAAGIAPAALGVPTCK